ncbi:MULTISPECIES: alpha/beta fold hydrolase [Streptomyces]|uniref:Uncharacterized protein n=1 Tax=Streptomyces thermogriseus TaxID=75292 RepID=A0ABP4DM73_9ACTN|nr:MULTISPECIES: hypothetical protein [unclassified Streptomyces]MDN5383603.1 hypothetical protein [Streptomyces sp. LB8]
MHQTTVGQATVHYRTEGQGPGLLLVHGTGATGETNYGHLLKHFTDHHTVIAPTTPAAATPWTTAPRSPWTGSWSRSSAPPAKSPGTPSTSSASRWAR